MKKKEFIKPAIKVVKIQPSLLQVASANNNVVTDTDGNAEIDYGGGSDEPARAPQHRGTWDE